MTLAPRIYRQSIAFDIPDDDFDNILAYDSANYREFDLPALSTMLDYIDGVRNTDYNGHFGAQVFADFDVDDEGKTPQLAQFQQLLEEFLVDARRMKNIMPEVVTTGGRHDVEAALLFDDSGRQVRRRLIYADDDFLISTALGTSFSIFHRKGGRLERVDAPMPAALVLQVHVDREDRSFDRKSKKQITMSKDVKGMREWVSTLIPLDIKVPTVDVSGHFLAEQLPEGARPVLKHRSFIVADSGREVGVSITFQSDGEFGTKWFTDGAREQILTNLQQSVGATGRLSAWILRQLPDDVGTPGIAARNR